MLAVGVVITLAIVGVGVLLLNRTHHRVVIVRIAKAEHTSSPAAPKTAHEYPAAPGAPSLKSVKAALAATAAHEGSGAAAGSTAATAALAAGAVRSFRALAETLPGRIELAALPLGEGGAAVLGSNEPAHGWSTTKVPVLVGLIKANEEAGRGPLSSSESALAESAITESSNESILALFADLERLKGGLSGASAYVESLFRDSGDTETVVTTAPPPPGAVTTFGQTEWRPSEAVKFFRALALGCLLPKAQTSYVLNLMEHIEASESWGLGSAGFASIAFKGGWGPNPAGAYLVRQSGIVDPGSASGVVISVVAFPSSGSFAAGTEMLDQTAQWLRREVRLVPRKPVGCNPT